MKEQDMAKQAGNLAEALAASVLGKFEGADVRRTGVEIPNVAGGLQKAMKTQPRVMKQGERGFIAFEYVVEKVRFQPIDKDAPAGDQERVHVLFAEGVTFVSEAIVGEQIRAQKEAIAEAERAASGNVNLDDALKEADAEAAAAKPKRGGRGRRGPVAAVPDAPDDDAE